MPEERCVFTVFHFRVRQSRLAAGTPVDDPIASVDQSLFVEIDKYFPHRTRTILVHRERKARPVARNAHLFHLFHNASAVFFFPCPGAFEESFAADILFRQPLFLHLLDDLDFRRDGRMITPRQIQRRIPLHTLETDQCVDDRVVQSMSQMQLSRNIGGRNHDRERNFGRIYFRTEIVLLHPFGIQPVLEIFRIVRLLHFHKQPSPFCRLTPRQKKFLSRHPRLFPILVYVNHYNKSCDDCQSILVFPKKIRRIPFPFFFVLLLFLQAAIVNIFFLKKSRANTRKFYVFLRQNNV